MMQLDETVVSWTLLRILEALNGPEPDIATAKGHAIDGMRYLTEAKIPAGFTS